MKKLYTRLNTIIMVLVIMAAAGSAGAQQMTDYTLYNNNMFLINPAYAGISDGITASTGFRKQWLGIDGAPQELNFTGHAYIPKYKVGVGLGALVYEAGAFRQTSVYTAYSYRIDLGFATLNFGLQAGVVHFRTNYQGAELNGVNDPLFVNDINQVRFNSGAGAFLAGERFYASFSVPVIKTYENKDNAEVKLERGYFLTGGYLFDVNELIVLKPYALMKVATGAPFTYNAGVSMYYAEHFGFGVMYKSQKTVAFNVELVFNKSVYLGYAYDLPGGQAIGVLESGSHEVMLNYLMPWGKGAKNERVRMY